MATTASKSNPPSTTLSEPTISQKDDQAKSKQKKFKQNWRINLLANAKWQGAKFERPEYRFNSGVAAGALNVNITDRIEHMSRPPLRTLAVNKKLYAKLPSTIPKYERVIDQTIDSTWNSIYNYYKKQKRDLLLKSSKLSIASKHSKQSKTSKDTKSGKGKGGKAEKGKKDKKGKKGDGDKGKAKGKQEAKKDSDSKSEEEIEKRRTEWVNLRAQPKPLHEPEPIVRGPIADLEAMKPRMDEMSTPRSSVKKFIETEKVDPTKINPAALSYEATERVLELSKPAAFRMVKEHELPPGFVSPGALLAIPTPRVLVLAAPRQAQNAREADLKEDPFTISPNALKYVATPRILELAKPTER